MYPTAMTCPFCEILNGSADGHILLRGEHFVAILSLDGHPLVLPKRHLAHLADLDVETAGAMFVMAQTLAAALRKTAMCTGVNLILSDGATAGQDVFHTHLHVKPRWADDDVSLTWNTTTRPKIDRAKLAKDLGDQLR